MIHVDKHDIERIGMTDPTVSACLSAYRAPNSGIKWESALAAMVHYLVEDKAALSAQLVHHVANAAPNLQAKSR